MLAKFKCFTVLQYTKREPPVINDTCLMPQYQTALSHIQYKVINYDTWLFWVYWNSNNQQQKWNTNLYNVHVSQYHIHTTAQRSFSFRCRFLFQNLWTKDAAYEGSGLFTSIKGTIIFTGGGDVCLWGTKIFWDGLRDQVEVGTQLAIEGGTHLFPPN